MFIVNIHFFSGFVKDEFTILPEVTDRVFSTDIYCKYWYTPGNSGVDYDNVWLVNYCFLRVLYLKMDCGPYKNGYPYIQCYTIRKF